MNTSLSKNGYKIKKNELDPRKIKQIKDDLNARPFTFPKNQKIDNSFQVYLESPKKLYLPATAPTQIYKSNLCHLTEKETERCKNRDKLNIYLVNGDIISSLAIGEMAGKHKVFKKHKKALFNHDAYTFYLKL